MVDSVYCLRFHYLAQELPWKGVRSWQQAISLNLQYVCVCIDILRVLVGKLTAIVGAVGSGKSSLLAAALGEMCTLGGSVRWRP